LHTRALLDTSFSCNSCLLRLLFNNQN